MVECNMDMMVPDDGGRSLSYALACRWCGEHKTRRAARAGRPPLYPVMGMECYFTMSLRMAVVLSPVMRTK